MLKPLDKDVGIEDNVIFEYVINQLVWVRMYGITGKWEKGVIIGNVGNKIFKVRLEDNSEVTRLRDQLKSRSAENKDINEY
ncbi:unnamed protein product [Gordionus sp. m RMFG-2023]